MSRDLPSPTPLGTAGAAQALGADLDEGVEDAIAALVSEIDPPADADLIRVPETPHGFLHFGGPAARGARAAIRHWLDARLQAD